MSSGVPSSATAQPTDDYMLIQGKAQSASGCTFAYRLYKPKTPTTSTSLVLGHGFMRDQDNMVGLSRAFANRGVTVATLDYCNMRPWNGHHERNARDMQTLARELGLSDNVIYAGFSAGALAAVLAADEFTRAVVTLDLVDQANLGVMAIEQLTTPLVGLSGPPSGCNASANGASVFNQRNIDSLSKLGLVSGASHCEFESPSDWLCELACGNESNTASNTASNKVTRNTIIARTLELASPYLEPLTTPTVVSHSSTDTESF